MAITTKPNYPANKIMPQMTYFQGVAKYRIAQIIDVTKNTRKAGLTFAFIAGFSFCALSAHYLDLALA